MTETTAVDVITEDDERTDLVVLFERVVEDVLADGAGAIRQDLFTIPGTDLRGVIEAGLDDGTWQGLIVINGQGETVWECHTGIDWEECAKIPEAFVAWFHEEQA